MTTTALLFALGGGGYYLWQQTQAPVILTYENDEYGFEIDYPDDWILEKIEDPFGTVARFYPQSDRGKDVPVEVTIEIEAIAVEPNIDLDDYSTVAISKIIKYLPEAKIIDSRQIELNNKPAHRIVYTGRKNNSDQTNKYLQVWFKKTDEVFILTYITPKHQIKVKAKIKLN